MSEHQELGEKLVKKGIWLYLFPLLSAPLLYINRIIISNDLSVSEVGIFYSVLGLFSIFSIYNDLGFTEALNFFLPRYWENKEHDKAKTSIYTAFGFQLITGILLSLLMLFLGNFLAINYFHSEYAFGLIRIFIIYFLFLNFFQTLQTLFLVFQDTFRSKTIEFVQTLSLFLAIVGIWKFSSGNNLYLYAFSWGISMFIALIIGFGVVIRKYLSTINMGKFVLVREDFSEVGRYAFWTLVFANIGILLQNLDQQFCIYFLGPEKTGLYTSSVLFLNLLAVLVGPFMAFMFPLTSQLFAQNKKNKVEFLITFLQKYIGVLSLGITVFFFVFAQVLVVIFLGEKFLESANILRWSIPFLYFNTVSLLYINFLSGMGKVRERINVIVLSFVINFVLSFILVQILGVYGIALTWGITFLVFFVSILFYFRKFGIKIGFNKTFFFKNLIFLFVAGFLLYRFALGYFDLSESRVSLLIKLAVVGVLCVLALGIINLNEMKMFASEMKRMLFKR